MRQEEEKIDEKKAPAEDKELTLDEKQTKEEAKANTFASIEQEIAKAVSEITEKEISEEISSGDSLEDKLEEYSSQSVDPEMMYGETASTDYSQLFSYLGNNVKLADTEYNSYAGIHRTQETMREDFFNPKYGEETINEVLRAAKIKNTYGVDVYINPLKKSMFDSWKLGNGTANKMMYDMISL